jgi:hypothetical protein
MSWSLDMASMRHAKSLLAALLIHAWALPILHARINVDTVPERDSVQLTIYNSVDLTMVRETRYLTVRKGMNHLEFSWANTLIDPTSVEFKALSHADEVEVLDVSFPPRVTNTLEWRVNSEFSGEVKVEIRYFTSGISWSADYNTEASRDEKLARLAGFVKVKNDSGEDYDNAQVRLVVGVIKLVEEIASLARQDASVKELPISRDGEGLFKVMKRPALGKYARLAEDKLEEAKSVSKEALSEYFLYTVEGRDTVPNGWAKRLPSLQAEDVPLTSYYKFEKEVYGDRVIRFYRLKNSIENKLGQEPLPDGSLSAYRDVSGDHLLHFVGQANVKYVPIGELVEVELGPDPEVMVKPVLTSWRKDDLRFDQNGNVSGWTISEKWKLDVRNSRDINVTVDLRRNFGGDWTLHAAEAHENVDAHKVKFVVQLKPGENRTLEYELVTRYGTNATR